MNPSKLKAPELIIFDLDGTLAVNSDFYRQVYSGTLEKLIEERHSADGLRMLAHCRKNYAGKGELALFALNIPFGDWAQRLINAPLETFVPQLPLVHLLRTIKALKIIYTGSPREMAIRTLRQLGFEPEQDFNLILGWQEPELFPIKWTCSPLMFSGILQRFAITPDKAWAVGDLWETDLAPAKAIGMKTILVRKQEGSPDERFLSIEDFLVSITREET